MLPLQRKSNQNPRITPLSNPVLQPQPAFPNTGVLPRHQVAVRPVIQLASTARRSESKTVGQGAYRVLQPGDRIDFGYITNCSVVLAENKEGGKVVYHWPLTAWTSTNIDTMEQALREIGWSYKSSDFSIRVWRQAYRDKPSAFEAEMKDFAEQLQAKFTRKVTYVIYEDKKVPTMDDNGEVTLLG